MRKRTYVFPDNSAEARTPQNTLARNFIHEQAFATEHGFTQSLALIFTYDALGAGEKGVFTHAPLLMASKLDDRDITDGGWGKEQFARPCVD